MARAVVSYIPALHQGYLKFLQDHPGVLYVIGPKFISEHPRLDRDIRAIEAENIVAMIKALGLMDSVKLLNEAETLNEVLAAKEIILPDEEINRAFAANHLKSAKISLEPAFLRWDKQISTTEYEVQPNRTISHKQLDRELIHLAQIEAKQSPDWWRQVGAVLVIDGQPALLAHNRPVAGGDYTFGAFGDPRSNFDAGQFIELSKALHAEAGLIAEAARRGLSTDGASLYITVFPCPNCAKSIAAAGIKKVFYHTGYSLLDAEDILAAKGVELIKVDMANPQP